MVRALLGGRKRAAKKAEQLDIPEAGKMLMLEGNAKKLLRIESCVRDLRASGPTLRRDH